MATKVSLSQVVEALELAGDEMSWFVHKQTGQVVMVSHEVMRLAERDADPDLPGWQEEELHVARDVLESTDWLGLPSKFDVHEWEIMNRFAQSVAVPAQASGGLGCYPWKRRLPSVQELDSTTAVGGRLVFVQGFGLRGDGQIVVGGPQFPNR